MGYAYGNEGLQATYEVFASNQSPQPDRYPLFNRAVTTNLGVIVHTNYAKEAIVNTFPQARVAYVPLPVAAPQPPASAKPDFLANLPKDTLLLGSFGYISPTKRLREILQVLAKLRHTTPPFRYLLVGQPVRDYSLAPLIAELGLEDIVLETGFVTGNDFLHYLDAVDIALNLRTGPTGGCLLYTSPSPRDPE